MKPAIEAMHWWDGEFSVNAYRRSAHQFEWNWHYHPEVELTLVTRGSGTRLVGDHRESYTAGDLVLLGPNLPHTWFSDDPGRSPSSNQAIVVQFHPSAFPESLLALPEFRKIGRLFGTAGRGLSFPRKSARRLKSQIEALPQLKGIALWSGLLTILAEVAQIGGHVLSNPIDTNARSFKMGSRLERVTQEIEARCDEQLNLDDVAASAGMTPSSFARYFRKMTGRTFVDFRNTCRIQRCCRALIETDRAIIDIALESGFQNLANFNRCFRRTHGLPPRDYRKIYQPLDSVPVSHAQT